MANGNFRIRLLDEPEQNSQDSDNTPAQDGVRPSGHRFSASERNSSTSRDVGWAENSNQSLMSKAPTMTNSEPDNSRADSAPPRSRSYAGGRSRSFKILDDPCMTQPFACSSLLDSDRQPPESNHDRPASLPAKPPQTPGVPQTPTDDSILINADSSLTLGGPTAPDAPSKPKSLFLRARNRIMPVLLAAGATRSRKHSLSVDEAGGAPTDAVAPDGGAAGRLEPAGRNLGRSRCPSDIVQRFVCRSNFLFQTL